MWLLRINDDGSFSLVEFTDDECPPYAILSHTWGRDREEVNFEDIRNNSWKHKAGRKKVSFCADQARSDGLHYFWVDTCCINKTSSAELSEAINSMFSWYENAARCYVFLADITLAEVESEGIGKAFEKCRWFTRGWTLQELIAPRSVEFFTVDGNKFGCRRSMSAEIRARTGIPIEDFEGRSLHQFCVHERMSWARGRATKRQEDSAYCLLGLFNVSLPLIYGEGRVRAFQRLREQVNKYSIGSSTLHPETLAIIGLSENILHFIDWLSRVLRTRPKKARVAPDGIDTPLLEAARNLEFQAQRLEPSGELLNSSGSNQASLPQCLLSIANSCKSEAHNIADLTVRFLNGSIARGDKYLAKKYKEILNSRKGLMTLSETLSLCQTPDWRENLTRKLAKHRDHLSDVLTDFNDSLKLSAGALQVLFSSHSTTHGKTNGDPRWGDPGTLGDENDSHTVEIRTNLTRMRAEAQKRHSDLLKAIDTFVHSIGQGQVFPVLPSALTQYDPSLKSLASNGYKMIENAVLQALWFRRMTLREIEINNAYRETCSWIFEEPRDTNLSHDNFQRWLQTGQGIFWIGGKAGCGKSTLLKFLLRDERTNEALKVWCGSGKLITASYFFWLAGSTLQKNQEGLLRSLLHSILSQRPSLISRVFPVVYNAMMTRLFVRSRNSKTIFACDYLGCGQVFQDMTMLETHRESRHGQETASTDALDTDIYGAFAPAELREAFLLLVQQLPEDLKLVCFVDGLDEYLGHHQDIITLFSLLAAYSRNIKLVLSSRPEAIFVQSFQKWPKLRVEDLTRGDIEHYVRDNLFAHDRMPSLNARNDNAAIQILNAVMSKSSGVFLWVFLIVRSLSEGLSDGSSLEELLQLTEEYPKELEDVYHQMFARMKDNHLRQAFRLLSCISRAQQLEDELPTLLRLSLTDYEPSLALKPGNQFSEANVPDMLLSAQARLRSRCCGLLEANSLEDEGRVSYLHRTVSEFVKGMTPMVEEAVEKEGFNPSLRLMTSILLKFKARDRYLLDPSRVFKGEHGYTPTVDAFFTNCQRYGFDDDSNPAPYVREFDRVLSEFWEWRTKINKILPSQRQSWMNIVPKLGAKIKGQPEMVHLSILARHYGIQDDMKREKCSAEGDMVGTHQVDDVSDTPFWAQRDTQRQSNFYADITPTEPQRHSWKGKKAQLAPKNKEKSGQSTSNTHDLNDETKGCARCKAFETLSSMNFGASDIDRALREAGVGNDISALVSWLVDRTIPTDAETAATKDVKHESGFVNHRTPQFSQSKRTYAQVSQGWTMVASTQRDGEQRQAVVGAVYEPKVVPTRTRKKKGPKVVSGPKPANERFDMGSKETKSGTFTWIFEPGLSTQQQARLYECLSSMVD